MPFTLSHPAAALLVARTGLPVTAVVAGTMVPDVPMFVRVRGTYGVTHSLVGVVTVDLLLGVLGVALWVLVVRDALVDVAPAEVRERIAPAAGWSRRRWALVPAGVLLGSLSHVAWDLFTHPGRWGARHVPWLGEQHAGLAGFAWAQYVSGVLGLLVVAGWAVTRVRSRPREARPVRVQSMGVRAAVLLVLAVALGTAVGGALGATQGPHGVAFHGAVVGTSVLALGVLLLALLWQWQVRRRRVTGGG